MLSTWIDNISSIIQLGINCGGRRTGPALLGQALLEPYGYYKEDKILLVFKSNFPLELLRPVLRHICLKADNESSMLEGFDDQQDEDDHDGEDPNSFEADVGFQGCFKGDYLTFLVLVNCV